jgi:hypothetical protein
MTAQQNARGTSLFLMWVDTRYEFPRAAVRNDLKLSGLGQQVILSQFWRPDPKSSSQQGWVVPLEH